MVPVDDPESRGAIRNIQLVAGCLIYGGLLTLMVVVYAVASFALPLLPAAFRIPAPLSLFRALCVPSLILLLPLGVAYLGAGMLLLRRRNGFCRPLAWLAGWAVISVGAWGAWAALILVRLPVVSGALPRAAGPAASWLLAAGNTLVLLIPPLWLVVCSARVPARH